MRLSNLILMGSSTIVIVSCIVGCTRQPDQPDQPDQPKAPAAPAHFALVSGDDLGVGYVSVIRDLDTGCEYIVSTYNDSHVTPRLQNGQPICHEVTAKTQTGPS